MAIKKCDDIIDEAAAAAAAAAEEAAGVPDLERTETGLRDEDDTTDTATTATTELDTESQNFSNSNS